MKPILLKASTFALLSVIPFAVFAETTPADRDLLNESPKAALQAGASTMVPMATVQELRGTVGSVIEAALDGDLEDVIDNLAKADRERLDEQRDDQDLELTNQARTFRTAWRDTYKGVGVDWSDSDQVGRALSFPLSQEGNNVIHMRLNADESLPGGSIKFVKEDGVATSNWRIDVSDSLTASQLRTRLSQELAAINSERASWGTDGPLATQRVAQRILSTIASSNAAPSQPGSMN